MSAPQIYVPEPHEEEQVRLLAAAFSDLHAVVSLVVQNGKQFLPGDSLDDLEGAWSHSQASFEDLINSLLHAAGPSFSPKKAGGASKSVKPLITIGSLRQHELVGPVGKAKRNLIFRLRDAFYRYWNGLPDSENRLTKIAHVAMDACEAGASVAGSIGGAIGGTIEEALLLIKQGLSVGLRDSSHQGRDESAA